MFAKVAVGIAYFIAGVYVLSILLPGLYCLQHGCKGPGEGDAFMPAFAFTPLGAIVTAFTFGHSIHQIRKRGRWSWAFWPLAIIFGIVLLGVIVLIALIFYFTVFHRSFHR